ncbi:MAG: transcription elongation factor GreB [Polyangiaceae bacterium]|nr:transcription elongation factor GreB [Polyangiaceae bacterium]
MEKGYISRAGHARLTAELSHLRHVERPKIVEEVAAAAAQGDRSENAEYIYGKKRMREIDRRMRFLDRRLDALVPMDVDAPRDTDKAYFGAWVTVEDEVGAPRTVRILGPDEVDPDAGAISYQSPLGRALLGKRPGDELTVRSPGGERVVYVTNVQYGPRIALREGRVRGMVPSGWFVTSLAASSATGSPCSRRWRSSSRSWGAAEGTSAATSASWPSTACRSPRPQAGRGAGRAARTSSAARTARRSSASRPSTG